MCNTSCGKSVITLKIYQKQSNLWKQQLITQGKLIQLVDINYYWMGPLLIAKPPITHKVNRIKIPHSNPRKLQLMYIYWIIKWKDFKVHVTCLQWLANYWLRSVIVYTLHVHASILHYINLAKSVQLTECTREISKPIKRNNNHWIWKRTFKRKLLECAIISHCYWLWSLIMIYMFQGLAKKQSRSHNQIAFFGELKQILFSCFSYELLQVFRFDSYFILRSKLVWTNNSWVVIVNNVGKLLAE